MDKFEWPDRAQMEKDAIEEGGLCRVIWLARLHVEALEAENATLREALEDTLTYLKVDIVGFTSRPERLKAPMDLYEEVKAALAAGEGEKAPPEPQSRSQERRFEAQGAGEGG